MTQGTTVEAPEGIAIVGMACRFPGARTIDEFWQNLKQGVESLSFFSDQELRDSGIDPALLHNPNYVKASMALEDIDRFDAAFFNMNRREAEIMDPQQRLFLECAYSALEHAAYDPDRFNGAIGVYAGVGANNYMFDLAAQPELVKALGWYQIALANEKDFLATRLAYKLNLRGPSLTVQTACSTALVATHIACQSLLGYDCDIALTGGSAIMVPQRTGYLYREGGINSPDGHCRAFDANAQGTVGGSGVGVVVLKRLVDAINDGDTIHAVIRSSAINNDGALKVGFTAPSQDGQAAVIVEAQMLAGVSPETITYVEAHGTGTLVGDPIEVAALTQAFRRGTDKKQYCALGSVKTNIGHLDTAAGVAGLIKAVLALKHRQIPPSLHFEQSNPKIDFANSPFYVPTQLSDWKVARHPRRAGVSAFGIGGTNAHVIVEEAPSIAAQPSTKPAHLLVLSAKTRTALDTATTKLADFLRLHPEIDLADLAHTLQVGRKILPHRRAGVYRDHGSAIAALEDPKQMVVSSPDRLERSVVFLFPGQGAQHPGMSREVYQAEPVFRKHLDYCAERLQPQLGVDLRDMLYPDSPGTGVDEQMNQTALAQPTLFAVEYALAQFWQSCGIMPQAMIGHSIGEYVAACLAGVLTLDDALTLVATRGRLMQALPGGTMLAVPLSAQDLLPLLAPQVALAAVNGPANCIVSGPAEAVITLQARLNARGVEGRPLKVSHAFHSGMMEPILEEFTRQVAQAHLQPPHIPYVSNVTGTWITVADATDPRYWAQQLRQTVRFDDGLRLLLTNPAHLLLEVGPGQTLTMLARRHPEKPRHQAVFASLNRPNQPAGEYETLLTTLGQLWLTGLPISWENLYPAESRRRIALPTYPFERESFWVARPSAPVSLSSEYLEAPMPDPIPPLSTRSARYDRILETLSVLVSRLSGAVAPEINPHGSLFDIGFDSLLLIQFTQAIQDELGVRVSLVQLLEQYTTVDSIATYVDQMLPPDKLADPVPVAAEAPQSVGSPIATPQSVVQSVAPSVAQPVVQPVAITPLAALPMVASPAPLVAYVPAQPADPTTSNMLERILAQQIQAMSDLMTQQLTLLRGTEPSYVVASTALALAGSAVQPVPAPAPQPVVAASVPDPAHEPVASQPAVSLPSFSSNDKLRIEPAPFVPYRPAEVTLTADLTPHQRAYLNEFIERYTQRTRRSREMAQEYRSVLADSRNTIMFRMIWKDLIYPIVGYRGAGAKLWDVDGNEYIDVTMGFGVHLFGHSPSFIVEAQKAQMDLGVQLGPQSYEAGEVARLICELTGVERVNFCNSGTEAVLAALRIARTVTRRTKVVCFNGAYHGWSDSTLGRQIVRDGKAITVPLAPGVSPNVVGDLVLMDYGKAEALETIRAHAHELAAVMVEPVQSRRPDLQPREFLHALRALTEELNIPLIFDEMVNGFRIHPGGAQAWFGIRADIVTYGKIVGGGMPIGVIAGKANYMDVFDGGMWQYGDQSFPEADKTTFAGAFFKHPSTMAATLATLRHLKEQGPALQERLNERTTWLVHQINAYFEEQEVPLEVKHYSSTFRFNIPRDAKYLDLFFYHLIDKGIYIWEGTNFFLSTAHTDEDLERIVQAVKESVQDMQRGGFFTLPSHPPRGNGSGGGSLLSGRNRSSGISTAPAATPGASSASQVPTSTSMASAHANLVRPDPQPGNQTRLTLRPADAQGPQFSLYYFGNYQSAFSADKYDLLLRGARFADEHGFTAVWIPERHFHSFGGFSPNPSVVAAALARETSRLQLRAGSVALPLHHPIRVAEEWSVVDNLSGGRVGISFASGWHPDDFVFAPQAYEGRREIMLEGIEAIRKLWRGEGLRVQGGAQSVIDAQIYPQPLQTDLPIWVTSVSKATFIKAGAIGAGVLTNMLDQSIEELGEKIALYRQSLAEHGFDPASGHVTVLIHAFMSDDLDTAVEGARQPFYNYLRSSLTLVQNMARGTGREVDFKRMSEDEIQYLLKDAYSRIVRSGTLIGTPDSCMPVIDKLLAHGVDEIACLVDFGIETQAALDGLSHLHTLAQRYEHLSAPRSHAAPPTAAALAESATYPLTEPQLNLWVLAQLGDDANALYNESVPLRLHGSLNLTALRQALARVVARHDSLRTIFSAEGIYQRVKAQLDVELLETDLSVLDPHERESRARALIAEDAKTPFDMVAEPPWRVRVMKLDPQQHMLILTIHHIITDGWSLDIVIKELTTIYAAICQQGEVDLPRPRQFRDYVAWINSGSQFNAAQSAEAYWLNRFAGQLPTLELPTDRPRPALRTFAGQQYSKTLDVTLCDSLRSFSAQHGVTLFMTLLGGFTALLHRISQQHDLVVGVPTAGQMGMGGAYLTGNCLNLLPIRSIIGGDMQVADHVRGIRRTLLEAYEHQGYAFGALVRKLQLSHDLSRPPLASVVFNLEKSGTGGGADDGPRPDLGIEPIASFTGVARFDININVFDHGDSIKLQCDYDSAIFDGATIQRWLDHFETLLAGVVADPHRRLVELPLLSTAEVTELLVTRNATAATYPADRCFHQLFEEQVARTPDAVAVIFGDLQLTYRELDQRANQLAHYLQSLGIGTRARVAICMERAPEMVIGLLGIWKAGSAFVPLDPSFPSERMLYIVTDADVQVLLTQEILLARLPEIDRPTLCLDTLWETIAACDDSPPPTRVSADQLAYHIYTSGSTGKPKGVLIAHYGLVNYLAWCVDAYTAARGRGAPVHASIAADAIFPSLFAPLMVGTSVMLLPEQDSLAALGQALQGQGPFSLVKITPSQLEVLGQYIGDVDPHGWIHTLVVGAEEVRGSVLEFWQQHAPETVVLNEYGPTETVVGCSVYAVPSARAFEGTVPIGLPIANTQFYVLDAHMQPVPIGVPGELYIGGDGVAWGYHNRPALTAEKFVPDAFSPRPGARLYRTGDLVRAIPDREGNIEFLGRIDDQVKIRGYRVEPGEVAAIIAQHPDVREAVVLAHNDPARGKHLVAYVVPKAEDRLLTADPQVLSPDRTHALRTFLSTLLPEYMLPTAFVFLEAIPLAPHGKIDRAALLAIELKRIDSTTAFVAPSTPFEQQIVDLWSQLLGVAEIGLHDNFFALGGDSLLAVRLISKLRTRFQIELPPRVMFERPTVAGLVPAIVERVAQDVDTDMVENLLSELETLSEEEMQALLGETLLNDVQPGMELG